MADASSARTVQQSEKRPEDIAKSSDFLAVVGLLLGLIFLAALVLWFLDRWRKRSERRDDPAMSLTNFRAMYEAGELTLEEYDRIRAKMAAKMKANLGLEAPPAPPSLKPPKSE